MWRSGARTRAARKLLRRGAGKLGAPAETPRAVIIDEAVELAKRYGAEDSGAFVNGILERIANDIGRKDADSDL